MSFKLFMLQTLGQIKPTEKIEARRQSLLNDYLEFQDVENSDELREFIELEKEINSEGFKQKKKDIQNLGFKGSPEFKQQEEFIKLSKSKSLKKYFQTAESVELKRFEEFKDSEKLTEYYELKDYAENGVYRKEKEEIEKQVFKGSVEEKHFKEFKKLRKSKALKVYLELEGTKVVREHEEFAGSEKFKKYMGLRNMANLSKEQKKELKLLKGDAQIKEYFRFEKGKKLKYYREIAGSHILARFNELNDLVNSDDFKKKKAWLEDKKKFEGTDAHKKYLRYKQLTSDNDIKFYLSFEKSKLYKNYLDVKDSFDLKRYKELKDVTESTAFKERKTWLEDKKKWEKSDEYVREQKYLEMKRRPQLERYFKYKGSNRFDFFKTWDVVFEENFENGLDKEKWSFRSYWAQKLVNGNFSQQGDLQCFTDGKNVVAAKNRCIIQVHKERKEGKFWNPAAGFVPNEFQYTSGQINTGQSFWFKEGILEAKIWFNPVSQAVSSFHLLGEKASPQLNLLEMGAKNRLGAFTVKNQKPHFEGISISGLKKGKPYIFGLEKKAGEFIFSINEKEVFRMPSAEFEIPMHLILASIVVDDIPASALPVDYEIGWVKCYKKK